MGSASASPGSGWHNDVEDSLLAFTVEAEGPAELSSKDESDLQVSVDGVDLQNPAQLLFLGKLLNFLALLLAHVIAAVDDLDDDGGLTHEIFAASFDLH